MSKWGRVIIGAAALALVVLVPFGVLRQSDHSAFGQAVQSVGTRVTHRAFNQAWSGHCAFDACDVPTIARTEITTPADADTVDLVLGATFDYKITAGDTAFVGAGISRKGQPGLRPLAPGELEIQSAEPSEANSTTLTWAIDGIRARGAHYTLSVIVSPYDEGGNGSVTVSGQKGLLVLYASA
jgi:hypothetical protein